MVSILVIDTMTAIRVDHCKCGPCAQTTISAGLAYLVNQSINHARSIDSLREPLVARVWCLGYRGPDPVCDDHSPCPNLHEPPQMEVYDNVVNLVFFFTPNPAATPGTKTRAW